MAHVLRKKGLATRDYIANATRVCRQVNCYSYVCIVLLYLSVNNCMVYVVVLVLHSCVARPSNAPSNIYVEIDRAPIALIKGLVTLVYTSGSTGSDKTSNNRHFPKPRPPH